MCFLDGVAVLVLSLLTLLWLDITLGTGAGEPGLVVCILYCQVTLSTCV